MCKLITILIPCYNEEAVLEQFYQRTVSVLNNDDLRENNFTLLFVNDGSTDNTFDIIEKLHEKDSRVSCVNLSRNFGKEIAMLAGIDFLKSDAVIIMDADLQDPPELIPKMIYWWRKGYEDVCLKRRTREGETFFKKLTSHVYYRLLQHLTDVYIQPDVGDFRLLDKKCIDALKCIRETQRYTKGLFSWIGFKKKEILFDRKPRAAGKTKWNYWKLTNLAIQGITSFSITPLRIASGIGATLSLIAIIYMLYIFISTLLYHNPVAGYPSLICVILFIGGIQLFVLGIIGEYLGRIFIESKNRPPYFVESYIKRKDDDK